MKDEGDNRNGSAQDIATTMGDGSVIPTCGRRPWRRNRVRPETAGRRALLMPGTGYNCDRPLLYYTAMALIENGWYVDRLDVDADLSKTPASRIFAMLEDAVDEWVGDVRRTTQGDPTLLVVGKSLSTFIYPHVDAIGVPMALLTPVFSPADFDPARSVIPVPGDDGYRKGVSPVAPLICAGTADPLYAAARARRLSGDIHEYPNANHSIEVPGDWRTSLSYLEDVTGQVVRFAASLPLDDAM
ncbi:hypothetical protein F7D09_0746 [Bifidobacterium leontopitheci]|uniref:Alpha/beta hydrolase n=2 Tax=Bifidobacterium leontopitheci TaxID=2650774 RepID=A0A6I1GGR0_9BIFI|nr:hypothetical protein F7D09_0746 [Bifidobacterium leontopitheci]